MATTSPALNRASAGSRALLAGNISATLFRPLPELGHDAGEVRDLAGGRADAGEQGKTVGAYGDVLVVDKHLLEEGVDRNAQAAQRAHRGGKVFLADGLARLPLGLAHGPLQAPFPCFAEQGPVDRTRH